MIKLEFTKSPDSEILGIQKRPASSITIGSSHQADIVIFDQALKNLHLSLFVLDNNMWIKNFSNVDFYHSNNKKISGKKIHQVNSIISIGSTEFKILDYKGYEIIDHTEQLKEQYKTILSTNPDQFKIIQKIEAELFALHKLEKKKRV